LGVAGAEVGGGTGVGVLVLGATTTGFLVAVAVGGGSGVSVGTGVSVGEGLGVKVARGVRVGSTVGSRAATSVAMRQDAPTLRTASDKSMAAVQPLKFMGMVVLLKFNARLWMHDARLVTCLWRIIAYLGGNAKTESLNR
jgi:hypothetical protein